MTGLNQTLLPDWGADSPLASHACEQVPLGSPNWGNRCKVGNDRLKATHKNMANPKKQVLTLEQFRANKAKEANPEQVQLVQQVTTYQDAGMGKMAIRLRMVIGGKVLGIAIVRFEDIDDCKGNWTPAIIRWKADSDTVKSLIEEIEEKGCELPPEQRTEKDESSE